MVTFVLILLFCIYASVEGVSYAIYEIKVNNNKTGGIIVLLLAITALIMPFIIQSKI